jgi:hypothetical protein
MRFAQSIKEEMANEKGKPTSHVYRLIHALEAIYEGNEASVSEKLQSMRLAMEALDKRPIPKRMSTKDKLLAESLGRKKKTWGGRDPNKKGPIPGGTEPKS